jgi:glycosyltransferase involved in cell wall biosynthesis
MKKTVVIRKGSQRALERTPDVVILDNEELRRRIIRFDVFSLIFNFNEARLLTSRLETLVKPLRSALILRMLSRGSCFFEDDQGKILRIDLKTLFLLVQGALKDWAQEGDLLRRLTQEVELLTSKAEKELSIRSCLDLSVSPLYLRTDLIFGLRSGGSVGHIAGVLNNLHVFTGQPVFYTTDIIPTVGPDIETERFLPSKRFWDLKEVPGLYFNWVLETEAKKRLYRRRVAFIYQRYCINNYSGAKWAKELKIPFVLEYNGSEIWVSRNWGRSLRYEALSEKIERLNLLSADVIVVVSHALKDELSKRGINAEKILVNPNGVDPERYSPHVDGSSIRTKFHLEGRTTIGFIGTFGKWHGAEVLAEAFVQLCQRYPDESKHLRLLMIGEGNTMPEVRARLDRLGNREAAILTGLIAQEEGPSFLAACDVLVASHVPNPDGTPFFGSPTKLFEYMAMGKGIVASDLDQIGEVLKHDQTAWLVKPGDVRALMAGLRVLVNDAKRRERLGNAAREEVVAKYTWKEHTRKIIEKLKERCG